MQPRTPLKRPEGTQALRATRQNVDTSRFHKKPPHPPAVLLVLVLLKLPDFLAAAAADPHRVVPPAGRHGAAPLGAVVAHSLATGAAVVDVETRGELPLALAAGADVLIRDPVGRPGGVLHQAWTGSSS